MPLPLAHDLSFWNKNSQVDCDYLIIGAGIIALSTAIALKERNPEASVLVLEQGILPLGASTRNAGFACIGSFTEVLKDIRVMGEEKALTQMKIRWTGLTRLRQQLTDKVIDFQNTGNLELITEALLPQLEYLERLNQRLHPIFGEDVFVRCDHLIDAYGFSRSYVKALVLNRLEGKLDSGKMMNALQQKAQALGVVIRYGSEAMRPYPTTDGLVVVPVKNPHGKSPIKFTANTVAICINGYTKKLIPEAPVQPGRGQIIVTKPLKKPLLFHAPCHMDEGFVYFRSLPGNRLLLGGCRNLNFEQETTMTLETTPDIMWRLQTILNQVILPGENPEIECTWAGLMAFTPDHLPIIQSLTPQIILVCGCNGMGVAIGSEIGQKTAEYMSLMPKEISAYPQSKL